MTHWGLIRKMLFAAAMLAALPVFFVASVAVIGWGLEACEDITFLGRCCAALSVALLSGWFFVWGLTVLGR